MLARLLQRLLAILLAAVPALLALPAAAGGSLPLAEVLQVVQGIPQIVRDIDAQRRKHDLKVEEIVCSAARHGNQWTHLGGARAAPYECTIGDRTVVIEADRTYYDVTGKRLGQLGQISDKVLLGRAKSFREGNFRWAWRPSQ